MSGVRLPQDKPARARRLTPAQASKLLGVTPRTVRRYINEGFLPAYSNISDSPQGVRYLIDEQDLKRFRAEHEPKLVQVA